MPKFLTSVNLGRKAKVDLHLVLGELPSSWRLALTDHDPSLEFSTFKPTKTFDIPETYARMTGGLRLEGTSQGCRTAPIQSRDPSGRQPKVLAEKRPC